MAAKFEGVVEPAAEKFHESDVLSIYDEEFKDWVGLKRSLRIVVTGKTGAGKSTLLNGFVGGEVCPYKEVEGFDPQTHYVKQHTFVKCNVEVTVWDCPGLQDGTSNEELYLQDLEDKTNGGIDVMLYCISMKDAKFDQECHGTAMLKLTLVLGKCIWNHTVIVLTFANHVVHKLKRRGCSDLDEQFGQKVKQWKDKIQQLMYEIKCTDEHTNTIEKIQVVPAGYKNPSLPGYKFWLSSLWIEIFEALKTQQAKAAALTLNKHRFRTDPDDVRKRWFMYFGFSLRNQRLPPVSYDDFKQEIKYQPIVILQDSKSYVQLIKVGGKSFEHRQLNNILD